MKPAGLAFTVALHSVIAAAALVSCTAVPPPPEPKQNEAEQESKQEVVTVRLLPSYPDGFDEVPCESSYRGIGILSMDGTIGEVSVGGPADKAGLRAHDFILNFSDLGQDRYMVGHKLILRVRREGREIEIPVVIGRVCYE